MTSEPDERPDTASETDDVDPGWPWSFILLVVAGGLYLILRFIQMINEYVLN